MPWNAIAETAELHEQFDKCLKLGIREDSTNRTTFVVFRKIRANFEEFVEEQGPNDIDHINGESTAVVSLSLILRAFRMRGPIIVCVVAPVDDFAVLLLKEFVEQILKSTTKH